MGVAAKIRFASICMVLAGCGQPPHRGSPSPLPSPSSPSGPKTSPAPAPISRERACAIGDPSACQRLAFDHGDRGDKAKSSSFGARTIRLLRSSCDTGDLHRCTWLGLLYSKGTFVPTDRARASQLWRQACDSGFGLACRNLANTVDDSEVALWSSLLQRACELGERTACSSLGEDYAEGYRLKQDLIRAVPLLERACELGEAASCLLLARLFREGRGVTKDAASADTLVARACSLVPTILQSCPGHRLR